MKSEMGEILGKSDDGWQRSVVMVGSTDFRNSSEGTSEALLTFLLASGVNHSLNLLSSRR